MSPANLIHCDCCSQKVGAWITPCLLTIDAIAAWVSKSGSSIGQPKLGTESDGLWRPFCCLIVLGSVCHIPLATNEGWSFSLHSLSQVPAPQRWLREFWLWPRLIYASGHTWLASTVNSVSPERWHNGSVRGHLGFKYRPSPYKFRHTPAAREGH